MGTLGPPANAGQDFQGRAELTGPMAPRPTRVAFAGQDFQEAASLT